MTGCGGERDRSGAPRRRGGRGSRYAASDTGSAGPADPHTLLALALAALAGALPFATSWGPVILVLSAKRGRGVHVGDLISPVLFAGAVLAARPDRRTARTRATR